MYNAHVAEVFAHRLSYVNKDVAEAKGIITRGALIGFARNPSLASKIAALVAMCADDIDAL